MTQTVVERRRVCAVSCLLAYTVPLTFASLSLLRSTAVVTYVYEQ